MLHTFGREVGEPAASLIDVKGTLYGTTFESGGTVFSITTSGAEHVLQSFVGGSTDGSEPVASLINVKGSLYGTTRYGGSRYSGGTVFSVSTTGAEHVIHSFVGGSTDGRYPVASLIGVKGTLYGTTSYGGMHDDGTVFSISTSGTEHVLYSFAGEPDGQYPVASLIDVNGTLYGTTSYGGTHDDGTVFSISTSGTESY